MKEWILTVTSAPSDCNLLQKGQQIADERKGIKLQSEGAVIANI